MDEAETRVGRAMKTSHVPPAEVATDAASRRPIAAPNLASPTLTQGVVLLASIASGLAVAGVYYAQPLLDAIGQELGISRARIGMVVAITQVGYCLGLIGIVPLGDVLDRRKLIIMQTALSVLAQSVVALAGTSGVLFGGVFLVGLLAVVAQLHVAHIAGLAAPGERGRAVGTVTTGIVTGILLARAAAGVASDFLGWRAIYFFSALTSLAVAALLCRALPRQSAPGARLGYVELVTSLVTLFGQERVLRIRSTLALLIFMSITVLWTSLSLALRTAPHLLTHTAVGMFGFAGVLGAMGAVLAGRQADGGRAQRTTAFALALMLVSWVPIAGLSYSLLQLVLGVVLIDFGLQAVHVSNQSLIYRVRPEAQSRLTAAYMVFYSIGCALGSTLSTLVFDLAGWLGVSALGFATSAVALLHWIATRRYMEG